MQSGVPVRRGRIRHWWKQTFAAAPWATRSDCRKISIRTSAAVCALREPLNSLFDPWFVATSGPSSIATEFEEHGFAGRLSLFPNFTLGKTLPRDPMICSRQI
jgi:hypothetical protein